MREYFQAQMSFVLRIAYVCVTNEEMTPQYVLYLAMFGNFALQAKYLSFQLRVLGYACPSSSTMSVGASNVSMLPSREYAGPASRPWLSGDAAGIQVAA